MPQRSLSLLCSRWRLEVEICNETLCLSLAMGSEGHGWQTNRQTTLMLVEDMIEKEIYA